MLQKKETPYTPTNIIWLRLPMLLLWCLSCLAQAQGSLKEAVIIGYVDNPTARSLTFSYKRNDFTLEAGSFETVLDSATNFFAVRFSMQHPSVVYMRYKDQTTRFYLSNGDTLRLRLNGNAPLETLSFDGASTAADHNNYMRQTNNKFPTWLNENIVAEALESKTPEDYHKFLDAIYKGKKEFLDKYPTAERDRFSTDFIDFAAADVDYWWAYHLMLYYQKYGINNPNADRKISESYFDFNLEVDNLSSKALHNEYYLRYVELWLKYEREKRNDIFGPQPPPIAFTEEKNRIERYARTKGETLKVLEEAFLPDKIISYLSRDEEGLYLNQMTFEKFRYKDQRDSMLEDVFIRIRTPERKYGWIPYSMVTLSERLITEQIKHPRLCFDVNSPTCGFDNILIGKVLYYMLTKDIVLMTQYETLDLLRKRAMDFQTLNRDYPEYNQLVKQVVDWQQDDRLNSITRLRVPSTCEAAAMTTNYRYEQFMFKRIKILVPPSDTANKQTSLPPTKSNNVIIAKTNTPPPTVTPNSNTPLVAQVKQEPKVESNAERLVQTKPEIKQETKVEMKSDAKTTIAENKTENKTTPAPMTQPNIADTPSNTLATRTANNTNNTVPSDSNDRSSNRELRVNISPSPDFVRVVSSSPSIQIDDTQKYMPANYGTSGYKPGEPIVFRGLTVNEAAPDFTLTDIDGKTYRLSDFAGKVIYIDFWATWCTLCKDPLIFAQSLVEQYKDKGVVFIFISIDREADREKWHNMVKSQQWAGIHSNERTYIKMNFQVDAVPNFFLIGKDGRIARNSMMRINGGLERMIDELLTMSSEDGK